MSNKTPQELCDYFDKYGNYIGCESIEKVHQFGLWHRSIHIWGFYSDNKEKVLVLSERKDSAKIYPGKIDCLVSGHYRHEELLKNVSREPLEEVNLNITIDNLYFIGIRSCASKKNKEKQYIFLLDLSKIDITNMYPIEAQNLIKISCSDLKKLHRKKVNLLESTNFTTNKKKWLKANDFINGDTAYYNSICYVIDKFTDKNPPYFFDNIGNFLEILEIDKPSVLIFYLDKVGTGIDEDIEMILDKIDNSLAFHKSLHSLTFSKEILVERLIKDIEVIKEKYIKNRILILTWLKYSDYLLLLTKSNKTYIRKLAYLFYGELLGVEALPLLKSRLNDENVDVVNYLCFYLGWNYGGKYLNSIENEVSSRIGKAAIKHSSLIF